MPEQLHHASHCTANPLDKDTMSLHLHIVPHATRTGLREISWTESCTGCGNRLTYHTGQVAVRNVLRSVRLEAVLYVTTYLHRQGLWGDQPLPDPS